MKYLNIAILMALPTVFSANISYPRKLNLPKIDKVIAIAIDGVREQDAEPFKKVQQIANSTGYYTYWYGKDNNCRTGQKYNISLPAYANFLTGTVDERINTNTFKSKLNKKTLLDLYKDSQLFSSWEPMINVSSDDNEIKKENVFIVSYNQFPARGDDELVLESFKTFYLQSEFTLVHFVDADNYAHRKSYFGYKKSIQKEANLTADLIIYSESLNKSNKMFIIFTDHSRGKWFKWHSHGYYIPESSEIWALIISPIEIINTFPMCDHTYLHYLIKSQIPPK